MFIPTENKAVQVSDIPSSKKLVFPKKGDMLFSRANTRELVAASCIVVEDSPNTFLPDKLWLIKTDENQLLPEFLNYLLKIPGFKEKLTSQATGSSGSMLNISMGKFEQTDCLIPPIDLQHRFKNLYWKLQETLSSFGHSESTLQASFNSLSQKAFSGQL
jgi:type I restriction enzyme S subunit